MTDRSDHEAGVAERALPWAGLAGMLVGGAELNHGNQAGELIGYLGAGTLGLTVVGPLVVDLVRGRFRNHNPQG